MTEQAAVSRFAVILACCMRAMAIFRSSFAADRDTTAMPALRDGISCLTVAAVALLGCAPSRPQPRVVDSGLGYVVLEPQNIYWSKPSSDKLAFRAAETYCRELNLAGRTGWRLPTVEEVLMLPADWLVAANPAGELWTSTLGPKPNSRIYYQIRVFYQVSGTDILKESRIAAEQETHEALCVQQ